MKFHTPHITAIPSKVFRKMFLGLIFVCAAFSVQGQTPIDLLLKEYNERTVPYITVQELQAQASTYLLLDTRKKEEFLVSHLPKAVWSGEVIDSAFAKAYPNKSQHIAVYCSVGIRSEDFGESLLALGYTNVKNVYGSIFAWKDEGYPIHNRKEEVTDSVHIFSRPWGKYLNTGIKVH